MRLHSRKTVLRGSPLIPDDKLDEVFTNTRIEDVGVKYDESEEEAVVEQASGNSFEEIDKAVETASKQNATNKECAHAGKVFSEMEGNELFNMIAERSQIIRTQNERVDGIAQCSNISSVKPMSEMFDMCNSINTFSLCVDNLGTLRYWMLKSSVQRLASMSTFFVCGILLACRFNSLVYLLEAIATCCSTTASSSDSVILHANIPGCVYL